MYAQQNDDMQSFRRGEHIIPANYAGNAFTLDEEPCMEEAPQILDIPRTEVHTDAPSAPQKSEPCESKDTAQCEKKQERGLLSDLLSRFSRKFELDDILLIGLIILLLQNDCDVRDETVILLALLLLSGF